MAKQTLEALIKQNAAATAAIGSPAASLATQANKPRRHRFTSFFARSNGARQSTSISGERSSVAQDQKIVALSDSEAPSDRLPPSGSSNAAAPSDTGVHPTKANCHKDLTSSPDSVTVSIHSKKDTNTALLDTVRTAPSANDMETGVKRGVGGAVGDSQTKHESEESAQLPAQTAPESNTDRNRPTVESKPTTRLPINNNSESDEAQKSDVDNLAPICTNTGRRTNANYYSHKDAGASPISRSIRDPPYLPHRDQASQSRNTSEAEDGHRIIEEWIRGVEGHKK